MSEQDHLSILMDQIVNPTCEDCGAGVNVRPPRVGPHFCVSCLRKHRIDYEIRAADYRSQERPRGRTIHVVKLPDGMKGTSR